MEYDIQVEGDVFNVAQAIYEYDPNLRLKFLDPSVPAKPTDAPWALYELCKDGVERLVFPIWQLDQRILERIFRADTQKTNVLGLIDSTNAMAKLDQQRRYDDRRAEDRDIAVHTLKNHKSSYSFKRDGKHVTIHDTRPPEIKAVD